MATKKRRVVRASVAVAVAVTRLQWAIDHKCTPDGAGVARCLADLIRAVVREEVQDGG